MLAAIIGLSLLLLPCGALLADQQVLTYLETHGPRSAVIPYGVARSADALTITSTGGGAEERMVWKPGVGGIEWARTEPGSATALRGRRTGNAIAFTGTLKGKEVARTVTVDAEPWYQIFGPAIADLLPAERQQRDFWVVNPDDLVAHKMMVRRAGAERITIGGASFETYRIHFSPAGALAAFWGADFWYRPSDSTWMYSRLPENGGLTVTTLADPGK